MSKYLMLTFTVLFVLQFFFPLLAHKIKTRFQEIGYEMNAKPIWSVLNVSNFWREARDQNKVYKDPIVSKLLLYRTAFWVFVGVVVIIGIVTTTVAPI